MVTGDECRGAVAAETPGEHVLTECEATTGRRQPWPIIEAAAQQMDKGSEFRCPMADVMRLGKNYPIGGASSDKCVAPV